MAIGNFGKVIVFSTSDQKILTFDDFKMDLSGRWATHNRILKKPRQQFLGPDLRKVTFTIVLSAQHGVKPRSVISSIENHITKGIPEKLVIGNKQISINKFVITKMSETWEQVWNKGELVRAKLELTLEEYV